MKRAHPMPFGAQPGPTGGARFQLWAPGAKAVSLVLEDCAPQQTLPMALMDDGWFGLDCRDASPGSLYRFELGDGLRVPDPASRCNPQGVHGPSQVVDPLAFDWEDRDWEGRPWEEAVVYELHVGTFTREGTFAGVEQRLDYLAELGVTAIELMPVAAFPGRRNWGYDGVLPFAPAACYGSPDDLKRLVQEAHRRGLMVMLDVVYNHFGPDGNYLHAYAPDFFASARSTPWGPAINFDGQSSGVVRDFFIHNALYWLEEFHLDGLRLDAVHAIHDEGHPHFLEVLARSVQQGVGAQRRIHLVLENDGNEAHLLAGSRGNPGPYRAQWNDDFHHAMHVLITGEEAGYYEDYAEDPIGHLGRCLTEGFAFQGQASSYRKGAPRGEASTHLPPQAFLNFLQTHDQVGNRAFGERLTALASPEALRAATAILLMAPSPPLLFMGEEFGAESPFLYFCDHHGPLADAVREGRRLEFSPFPGFSDPKARASIPDPNAEETFLQSRLDWHSHLRPSHAGWYALHQRLLALRRRYLVPRLSGGGVREAAFSRIGHRGLASSWQLADGSLLSLSANLSPEPEHGFSWPAGVCLFSTPETSDRFAGAMLPPWAVIWCLQPSPTGGDQ